MKPPFVRIDRQYIPGTTDEINGLKEMIIFRRRTITEKSDLSKEEAQKLENEIVKLHALRRLLVASRN
jgi:hypothetical protein